MPAQDVPVVIEGEKLSVEQVLQLSDDFFKEGGFEKCIQQFPEEQRGSLFGSFLFQAFKQGCDKGRVTNIIKTISEDLGSDFVLAILVSTCLQNLISSVVDVRDELSVEVVKQFFEKTSGIEMKNGKKLNEVVSMVTIERLGPVKDPVKDKIDLSEEDINYCKVVASALESLKPPFDESYTGKLYGFILSSIADYSELGLEKVNQAAACGLLFNISKSFFIENEALAAPAPAVQAGAADDGTVVKQQRVHYGP